MIHNNNLQTILTTWNNLEESWTFKASTDDFIFVALESLGIAEDDAIEIIDHIGDAYYDASCDGASESTLATMILASIN